MGMNHFEWMDRTFRQMDRLLDEFGITFSDESSTIFTIPSGASFYETPTEYTLTLDVPGHRKDDFDIQIVGTMLRVKAEQEVKLLAEMQKLWGRESAPFNFEMRLPPDVDVSKIGARYNAGVLALTLEKVKDQKSEAGKKIEVT